MSFLMSSIFPFYFTTIKIHYLFDCKFRITNSTTYHLQSIDLFFYTYTLLWTKHNYQNNLYHKHQDNLLYNHQNNLCHNHQDNP